MVKAVTVDFSGVKDRGEFSPKQVPVGDYAAKITKVDDKPSKEGKPMFTFTIKLQKFSQNSYPYYCVVQENQLWKLRNLAVAAGINVPKKRLKFDPNKVVGKSIGVTLEDDEPYTDEKGKTTVKSVISAVFPMAELAEGAEMDDDTDDDFDEESTPQLAGDDGDDDAAEDEAAAEEKPKKKKDKGAKDGAKKKKKGKKSDTLDISDV